jgi:hypothetical protein
MVLGGEGPGAQVLDIDRLDLKRANIEGHSEAAELGQPAGTIERRWAA